MREFGGDDHHAIGRIWSVLLERAATPHDLHRGNQLGAQQGYLIISVSNAVDDEKKRKLSNRRRGRCCEGDWGWLYRVRTPRRSSGAG